MPGFASRAAGRVVLDHSAVGTTDSPNTATQKAGGVWADGGVTLSASRIEGNGAATDGGGVVVGDGNVTLTGGSSISRNQAPQGLAGGIAVASGSVFLDGASHVDQNSAKDIGGIMVGQGGVFVVGASTVNRNSSTGGTRLFRVISAAAASR